MNVFRKLFFFDDRDDIAHFEDEVIFVVDFYLRSGVFVVHDTFADFYGDFVFFSARSDGDDFCPMPFSIPLFRF